MKTKKKVEKSFSEQEIDNIIIAQDNDNDAWEKAIRVRKWEKEMELQQIDKKYLSALKIFNSNVENAVTDFLILNLSRKISEFQAECEALERKYETNFNTFEKRLNEKINEENFENEDDYMAWKFAEESKRFLQKKLEEIS